MASFITPQNGDDAVAEHVAQLTEDFQGLRNIPLSLTGVNDAASYAQTIKNAGTGSKGLIIYAADGTTVLLQVDSAGVQASAAGGAAAPILTGAAGSITPAMMAATAWTPFTPTVTQAVSVTASVANGRYLQLGKLIIVSLDITLSSAGTAGNSIIVGTLPVACRTTGLTVGHCSYVRATDSSRWPLAVSLASTTTFGFYAHAGTSNFGITPAVTAATGDILRGMLWYEAA